MAVNLKKEGAAIRSLLEQADGIEMSAETALEKARMDADEMRWSAAERCFEALTASGLTQKQFSSSSGIHVLQVSQMTRAWVEWQGMGSTRPRYNDAVEMIRDRTVAARAEKAGRSPARQARFERTTKQLMRDTETAEVIMGDPAVRESARRAIVAAEATEAKSKLMANANPVDLPAPVDGFNWLEADATLSHARKLINSVSRMVKKFAPLSERDLEMVTDGAREVHISLTILDAALKAGDIDEALIRLLDGEA